MTLASVARTGMPIILDPAPDPDGYIYPVGHVAGRRHVAVVGTPAEVPRNEPFRYREHRCGV